MNDGDEVDKPTEMAAGESSVHCACPSLYNHSYLTVKPSSSLNKSRTIFAPKFNNNRALAKADAATPRSISPAKDQMDKNETPSDSDRVLILVELAGSGDLRPFRIKRNYTVASVLKGVAKVLQFDYTR